MGGGSLLASVLCGVGESGAWEMTRGAVYNSNWIYADLKNRGCVRLAFCIQGQYRQRAHYLALRFSQNGANPLPAEDFATY